MIFLLVSLYIIKLTECFFCASFYSNNFKNMQYSPYRHRTATPWKEIRARKEPPIRNEYIGEVYDEMREQRAALQAELEGFDIESLARLLTEMAPEELVNLYDTWYETVNTETLCFDFLDRFDIFIDSDSILELPQLYDQGSHMLGGRKIVFESPALKAKNKKNMNIGVVTHGRASSTQIEILDAAPTVQSILLSVANSGRFPEVLQTLIHEIVHTYHQDKSPTLSPELTEAQAWVHSLLMSSTTSSIWMLRNLIQKKEAGGGYGFDTDKVLSAYIDIMQLYAMGVSADTVANTLFCSTYDDESGRYDTLAGAVEARKFQDHLSNIDVEALTDTFRTRVANDWLNAQIILLQLLNNFRAEKK